MKIELTRKEVLIEARKHRQLIEREYLDAKTAEQVAFDEIVRFEGYAAAEKFRMQLVENDFKRSKRPTNLWGQAVAPHGQLARQNAYHNR